MRDKASKVKSSQARLHALASANSASVDGIANDGERKLKKLRRKYARKLRKNFHVTVDTGDEEAVHDLRVATRRLQALLELVCPNRSDPEVRSARKDLKKLRHVVGEERDLRLFLQTARRRSRRAASLARRRVWRQLAADLSIAFDRASHDARERLQRRSADAVGRRVSRLVRAGAALITAGRVARVLDAARAKLIESIRAAHVASAYHNVRIKAKSLRYLLEARAKLASARGDETLIERLKSVQDELGDWHDEVELCRRAAAILSADADRQADPAATRLLDSMRTRMVRANEHARDVVAQLARDLNSEGSNAENHVGADGAEQRR